MTLLVLSFTFFGSHTVFNHQDGKTRREIDHRKVMFITGAMVITAVNFVLTDLTTLRLN